MKSSITEIIGIACLILFAFMPEYDSDKAKQIGLYIIGLISFIFVLQLNIILSAQLTGYYRIVNKIVSRFRSERR